MADEREPEKLLFCNIAELDIMEGKTDEGYIGPVLVFRDNDGGTGVGYVVLPAHLKPVESFAPEGNNHLHETIEGGSRGRAGKDKVNFHGFSPSPAHDAKTFCLCMSRKCLT